MQIKPGNSHNSPLLNRPEGVTRAERHLASLCQKSILSLWSYPGIYRDQGQTTNGGDGKEVCDLLVVFENHLIIFSDKDCMFPDTGDLDLDWSRWYRRAIQKSAEQIWGAERWIRDHPDRLFLDRGCTQPFPINLPSFDRVKIHRILVAHSASERCRHELGGSGSLMIVPSIVGEQHYLKRSDGGMPFAIGCVEPNKGYMHILDDTTLDIVLGTLDTISDFVTYLEKKERFINNGKLAIATGEEDLLAYYLQKVSGNKEHDFVIPPNIHSLALDEGFWEEFASNPQRKAQITANEISYSWDALIESFLQHYYAGTSYWSSPHPLSEKEMGYRLMAREPRTRRRMLARALLDLIFKTSATQRATRTIFPSKPEDPCYVFLVLPHLGSVPYEEYREVRRYHLGECCLMAKANCPNAQHIIGIATESGRIDAGSEDMVHFDGSDWTAEQQLDAEQMAREYKNAGVIGNYSRHERTEKEYPDVRQHHQTRNSINIPVMKGRDRNTPCPCGSGQKYKKCHGA